MQKVFLSLLTACLMIPTIAAAQAPATAAESVASAKLIPRTSLFGHPEKERRASRPTASTCVARAADGVLNVWVAGRGKLDAAKAVTIDRNAASASTSGRSTTSTCSTSRTRTATRTPTSSASTSRPADHRPHAVQGCARRARRSVVEEARRGARRPERSRPAVPRPVRVELRHRRAHAGREERPRIHRLRLDHDLQASARGRSTAHGARILRRVGDEVGECRRYGRKTC